ncbi:ABC-F family ATP-binding cassette domain-containing protein [Janthinobacterium sp.]|uniref:ABC-F family ATP-binding cassette domain-containing protein n=1 Tax=Janthinobacterium sp. TaxID=1871054 RepID=UPI002631EA49|nr:ABC-F family ATP-binding cassette domain-containing protein [Janthinobacterium sp.]
MTTLISTLALHLESYDGFLFSELAFTLRQGDRIGLIGHNGCGKSTLLGLLSGKREATSGTIHTARACRLQHVEQHLPAELASLSLYDALLAPVLDHPEWHWRIDSLLAELGFDAATAQVPVRSLSGGQHTRLLLGRALLQEPNVLLLDEPSNHLDLPSLLWLERFLAQWRGALILVSHDQRLLDNVTTRSWILRDGRIYDFELPCGPALTALAEADVAAAARHAAEQKEIDRLAVSSKRLAVWGQVYDNENLARKAKTMQRRIAKLKDEQAFVSDGAPWRLSLRGKALAAKQLLAIEALDVRAVPQSPVLFHVNQLWLKPGDRVALLGANGSGKSSLLRLCWQAMQAGEEDQRLDLRFHRAANVGYYDQSLQQLADEADLSDALYPFAVQNEVSRSQLARRQALISAGFGYARHGQKVATLSGGERARLLFLGLSLASYHLLLLDEPSNHLDMQGKQELGIALQGFEGGCLLVSHDRDLIETACNRFWVVADGKLEEWPDAPSAYARLSLEDGLPPVPLPRAEVPIAVQSDVDLQLERLCELEKLLAEDLARKPRHQKPASQRVWQEELDQLNRALGISA